jgi:hypothetical protein
VDGVLRRGGSPGLMVSVTVLTLAPDRVVQSAKRSERARNFGTWFHTELRAHFCSTSAMQKVEGSNPFSRFPGIRFCRASNGVLSAPLAAVDGNSFRAGSTLGPQTLATRIDRKRL